MIYTEDDIARFWDKVDKKSENDCWEFMSYRDKKGYGIFTIRHKNIKAHRFSYMLAYGEIPEGLLIRHFVCDNPSCVNPNHLKTGTNADNSNDCISKNRNRKGEGVNTCKLTRKDVLEIRRLYGERRMLVKDLSNMFRVNRHQILSVATGRSWKHIDELKNSFSRTEIDRLNRLEKIDKMIDSYKNGQHNISALSREYKLSRSFIYELIKDLNE